MNRDMRVSFDATSIEIVRGEQTVVQIEIPPDVVSRIQSLVESVTDPDEFRDAVYKDNPFRREGEVSVVGHKRLEPAEAPIGRPN